MTNRSLTMFESRFFCRLILMLDIYLLGIVDIHSLKPKFFCRLVLVLDIYLLGIVDIHGLKLKFFCRLILVLKITGLAVFGVQSQTQALLQTHTGVRDHNIYWLRLWTFTVSNPSCSHIWFENVIFTDFCYVRSSQEVLTSYGLLVMYTNNSL